MVIISPLSKCLASSGIFALTSTVNQNSWISLKIAYFTSCSPSIFLKGGLFSFIRSLNTFIPCAYGWIWEYFSWIFLLQSSASSSSWWLVSRLEERWLVGSAGYSSSSKFRERWESLRLLSFSLPSDSFSSSYSMIIDFWSFSLYLRCLRPFFKWAWVKSSFGFNAR